MKVLVVDSGTTIRGFVQASIRLRWPDSVLLFTETGARGLEDVAAQGPELVMLHDRLTDMDVNKFIQEIRRFSSVLVMVLGEEPDKTAVVRALTAGADDYVRLPCPMSEMMARVWASIRRNSGHTFSINEAPMVSGELLISASTREVYLGQRRVALTVTEFRLLHILARCVPEIVSHETLGGTLWGDRDDIRIPGLVKKYVQRLRRKLGDCPSESRWIASIHGVGYRFAGPRPECPGQSKGPGRHN